MKTLAVIPCGKVKIWDKEPNAGPLPARLVYKSSFHKLAQGYAAKVADATVILSALHGFLRMSDVLFEAYDCKFGDQDAISTPRLTSQIYFKNLNNYDLVLCLTGKHYADVVEESFYPFGTRILRPLEGKDICAI